MAIWSLRGLVIPLSDKYELWVRQKAAVGGCNGGGSSGYNVGGWNSGSSYNIGGYTMVACSALYKQLCQEFGVSHNCVCIISGGPLIYVVTCLELSVISTDSCNLILRFSFNWFVTAIAPAIVVRLIGICTLR